MRLQEIRKLPKRAWKGGLKMLRKPPQVLDAREFGFDTEWDPATSTLAKRDVISYQLLGAGVSRFIETPPGSRMGFPEIRKITGPGNIVLYTWFSAAEIGCLDATADPTNPKNDYKTFGGGSTDCLHTDDEGFILIFDLARFFQKSLKSVAEDFGLEKLDFPMEKMRRPVSPEQKTYAMRDAEICYEIGRKLRETFIDKWRVDILVTRTAARTAMTIFRKDYLKEDLPAPERRIQDLCIRSMAGGRSEAFMRGVFAGNWRLYDFKSMYPTSIVQTGKYPRASDWAEVRTLRELSSCIDGVARVSFRHPTGTHIPSIGLHSGNAYIYPLEGVACCTFAEIKVALSQGCTVLIREAYGYRDGVSYFQLFMMDLLEGRKRAGKKSALGLCYKLLANAGYGKLMQHVKHTGAEAVELAKHLGKTVMEVCATYHPAQIHSEAVRLGLKGSFDGLGSSFYPAWACLITGRARARLSGLLAGLECSVAYCHTDSAVLLGSLPESPEYSLEAEVGKILVARGKLIKAGKKEAHHGLHARGKDAAAKIEACFEDFAAGKPSHAYRRERLLNTVEAWKTGAAPGQAVSDERETSLAWDQKRELLPDGSTRAWRSSLEHLKARRAAKLGGFTREEFDLASKRVV